MCQSGGESPRWFLVRVYNFYTRELITDELAPVNFPVVDGVRFVVGVSGGVSYSFFLSPVGDRESADCAPLVHVPSFRLKCSSRNSK